MPIYEYYCPDNHRIYQFYAKTLAQGRSTPKCPDDPRFRMVKLLSAFSVTGKAKEPAGADAAAAGERGPEDDPRLEAAMSAMEQEFAHVDENDPRAMGRMMRRMAELTGEPLGGEMEEVVRKLEEGADPESLENQLDGPETPGGETDDPAGPGPAAQTPPDSAKKIRRALARRGPAVRDPKLYDYD